MKIMDNNDKDNKYEIKEILRIIIKYYKDNKKVIYLVNINQLVWFVKIYIDNEEDLIEKLLY